MQSRIVKHKLCIALRVSENRKPSGTVAFSSSCVSNELDGAKSPPKNKVSVVIPQSIHTLKKSWTWHFVEVEKGF